MLTIMNVLAACLMRCKDSSVIVLQAQQQPQVRTNSTVVIGYCFGAAAVLDLAASYPDPITDNVLGDFTSPPPVIVMCQSTMHADELHKMAFCTLQYVCRTNCVHAESSPMHIQCVNALYVHGR